MDAADLTDGASNLVLRCAQVKRAQRVLVIAEDPALGWYDTAAPAAVAAVARQVGAEVKTIKVDGPADPPKTGLTQALASADVAIFFARIGDQCRFIKDEEGPIRVMSYARNAEALASEFGRRNHDRMLGLKQSVDRALSGARRIIIRCPRGTHLSGHAELSQTGEPDDVGIRRFPQCVPAPVSAKMFSGRVVLSDYLTSTCSQVYNPAWIAIPEPVIAEVELGRIVGFHGSAESVKQIEMHYATVANRFGIQADIIHSWHAGIHDACRFDGSPDLNPDLWSNSIFGSPKYLHFHTCGDYAPGEICWMVAAPKIIADENELWLDGNILYDNLKLSYYAVPSSRDGEDRSK